MSFFWQYIWWIVGVVGIPGLVLVVVFWPFVAGTKIGRVLIAIGGVVLAGLVALGYARQQGIELQRKRQEKENADFIKKHQDFQRDIDTRSDAELDRMLGGGKSGDPQSNGPGILPDSKGTGRAKSGG